MKQQKYGRTALVCVGIVLFQLTWHVAIEMDVLFFGYFNSWICTEPKLGIWYFDYFFPLCFLAYMTTREGIHYHPLPWAWSCILWPIFIQLLGLIHLFANHKGMIPHEGIYAWDWKVYTCYQFCVLNIIFWTVVVATANAQRINKIKQTG